MRAVWLLAGCLLVACTQKVSVPTIAPVTIKLELPPGVQLVPSTEVVVRDSTGRYVIPLHVVMDGGQMRAHTWAVQWPPPADTIAYTPPRQPVREAQPDLIGEYIKHSMFHWFRDL